MAQSTNFVDVVVQVDSRATRDENEHLEWKVAVHINRDQGSTTVVKDPLSKAEKLECTWYLEQYAQESPFYLTRARKAADILQRYPTILLQNLRVQDILRAHLGIEHLKNTVLKIHIAEEEETTEQSPGLTAHQLFWETLEDPAMWHGQVEKISVQRWCPYPDSPSAQYCRIRPWQTSSHFECINILLIIARDLTSNQAVQGDVKSTTALAILTKLRQQMQAKNPSRRVNLEIVRPGTFAALEAQLEARTKRHGPGYFHFVHFDMHGLVADHRGTKKAFLYFSAPWSDRTAREEASVVGLLLARHQVPFVVLNACQSAKADSGSTANLAKCFIDAGVQSVLGVSTKISNNAVSIYLSVFYEAFLIYSRSFGAAAALARSALRQFPSRSARFGLKRNLIDWCTLVSYSSKQEISLTNTIDNTRFLAVVNDTDIINNALPMEEVSDHSWIGRDIDLLRLEKKLMQSKNLYIHGPASVGKTTLLQHAIAIWRETAFADYVLNIDFTQYHLRSASALLREICKQMQLGGADLEQRWDDSDALSLILNIVARSSIIIVLDNIHLSHSRLGDVLTPGSLTDVAISDINTIFDKMKTTEKQATGAKLYLVLLGRQPNVSWVSHRFGLTDSIESYQLDGLQLTDSIELGLAILRQSALGIDVFSHSDMDSLELVVGLLDGIPGALHEVLPLAARTQLPWREFYNQLLFGIIPVSKLTAEEGMTQLSSFTEIMHFYESATDDYLASFLALGMYWHEWPMNLTLATDMVSLGLFSDQKHLPLFMHIATELGFVRPGEMQLSVWMHPLMTLYARTFILLTVSISTPQILEKLIEQHGQFPLTNGELEETRKHFNLRPKSLKVAKFVFQTLFSTVEFDVPNDEVKQFRSSYLRNLDLQWFLRESVRIIAGLDLTDLRGFYIRFLPNILTCINLCVASKTASETETWPMLIFFQYLDFIRLIASPAETIRCADAFETLLNVFIRLEGGLGLAPLQQGFALHIANDLAALHRQFVSVPQRRHDEFIQLAADIVTASEGKFGPSTDPLVMYEKGYVMRHQTISALQLGRPDEALEIWKRFLVFDKMFFERFEYHVKAETEQQGGLFDKDFVNTMVNILSQGEAEGVEMRARLEPVPGFRLAKQFHESRKHTSSMMEGMLDAQRRGDEGGMSKLISGLEEFQPWLRTIRDTWESMGMTGFENDRRSMPPGMDMVNFFKTSDKPTRRLAALEEARDIGNWAAAAEEHQVMLSDTFKEMDFEALLQHGQALEMIYQNDRMFQPLLQHQKKSNRIFQTLERYDKLLGPRSVYTPAPAPEDTLKQVVEALEELLEAASDYGAAEQQLQPIRTSIAWWLLPDASRERERNVRKVAESRDTVRQVSRALEGRGEAAAQEFSRIHAEICRIGLEQSNAEVSGDPIQLQHALSQMDELEELAQTEFGAILINPADLDYDRQMYTWKRDLLSSKWKAAMQSCDFSAALAEIERLCDAHGFPRPSNHSATSLIPGYVLKIFETMEKLRLDILLMEAEDAQREHHFGKAMEYYHTITKLNNEGVFSNVKPDQLEERIKEVRELNSNIPLEALVDGLGRQIFARERKTFGNREIGGWIANYVPNLLNIAAAVFAIVLNWFGSSSWVTFWVLAIVIVIRQLRYA